jgi:hypothetical protein
MGGKESKDIQRNDVENSIKTTIKNDTENLSKQYNEIVSKISTSLVNSNKGGVMNQSECTNLINLSGTTIKDSKLKLNQACKVDATTRSIMNIISSQSNLSDFANKISSQVQQNTENSTALKAKLDSVNKLSNATSTQEGLESTITKCLDSVTSILKPGEKVDNETINTVKNSIEMNMENKTVNSTDVTNINKQISDNLSKNLTDLSCKSVTNASNSILAIGSDISKSDLDFTQSNLVSAFNDCIVSTAATSEVLNKIANKSLAKGKTDTSNTTTADQTNTSDNTLTNTKKTTSGFADIIMYIVIGLVVVGAAVMIWGNTDNITAVTDAASDMAGGSFYWLDSMNMRKSYY